MPDYKKGRKIASMHTSDSAEMMDIDKRFPWVVIMQILTQ